MRESCYPFYEPSYTELFHGCSQEVQFKRWQKEVAVRILRTQERRRSEALDQKARVERSQIQRKKVIASQQSEIFRPQKQRTQGFVAEVGSQKQRKKERRTEERRQPWPFSS